MKKKVFSVILAMVMFFGVVTGFSSTAYAGLAADSLRDTNSKAPSATNEYYIKTTYGGKNNCLLISSKTGSVLPNCVGYAWGRVYEITGVKPALSTGNAQNWYTNTKDGYARGKTPRPGAVICWNRNGNGSGHVAVVEKVEGGSVTISQSHYGGNRFDTKVIKIGNESSYVSGFQGYIYIDFTVKYDCNGGTGSMENSYVIYGVNTKLDAGAFTKEGSSHAGWNVQRKSDGAWLYSKTSDGTLAWYQEDKQPAGYVKLMYDDGASISKTVKAGDTITLYAVWEKDDVVAECVIELARSAANAASIFFQRSYYPRCSSKETSLVDALKALKIDSSMSFRTKIAAANGITGYSGSYSENVALLSKLKAGTLIKP